MSESGYDFSQPIHTNAISPDVVTNALVSYTGSNPDALVQTITFVDDNKEERAFQVALSSDVVQYQDLTVDNGIVQVHVLHDVLRMNKERSKVKSSELPTGLLEQINMFGAIAGFYKTKEQGAYSTPMKANKLFDAGVQYLQNENHHKFPALIAQWDRDEKRGLTDNVDQYDSMVDLLRRQEKGTLQEIQQEAVFATWTGQRAAALKFTKSVVFDDGMGVTAVFYE